MSEAATETADVTLLFGKHKGELLTRVPLGYLRWMINTGTQQSNLAKVELERRGGEIPTVEVSGHAIDNASLRILDAWALTRGDREGLYSWLMRMTLEALADGKPVPDNDGAYFYHGVKWVIAKGEEFPVLKTVMPEKEKADG